MNKFAMVLVAVAAICSLAAGAETSAFWNANPKWLNYGNSNPHHTGGPQSPAKYVIIRES